MRPRRLRRLYALAGFGAILAGAVLGTGIAKADTNVCASLAVSPTVGTVEQLVMSFMAEGLTAGDSGEVIAITVLARCPEYRPVLERFISAYGGPSGVQRA
jgi:hypothetical protein